MIKDFNEAPALGAAERTCFHDADAITNLRFIFLVMGMKLGDMFGDFSKLGVRNTSNRSNNDGFIHLVGNDLAYTNLTKGSRVGLIDCG